MIVVKIGGSVLDSELPCLVDEVVSLQKSGERVILVHGGQFQLNEAMKQKGLEIRLVDGLRFTSKEVLELAEEVFNNISVKIKSEIEKQGLKCLILNKDTGFVKSRQNKELGFVGVPEMVDVAILKNIPENVIPVVPSVTAGMNSSDFGFNCNADDVAGFIASKIKAERLVLLTDVDGVFDGNRNLLTTLTMKQAGDMIEGKTINGGMIPKVHTCVKALKSGVEKCHIIKGCSKPLISEIINGKVVGTTVQR